MTTAWDRFLDAPFVDWPTFAVQAKAAAEGDLLTKHDVPLPRRKVRQAAVVQTLTAEQVAERLRTFEEQYGLGSEAFYAAYNAGKLLESADYTKWASYYEMAFRQKRPVEPEAPALPPGMVNAAFCGHCFYGACLETGCQVPERCHCSKCHSSKEVTG